MKSVRARSHAKDSGFTLAIWRYNAGNALPLDNDPNTTPPPAAQILTIAPKRDLLINVGSGGTVRFFGIGGTTTLTLQPWFFDTTRNLWIKFVVSSAPTLTDNLVLGPPQTGGANVGVASVGGMLGAKFFAQITINDQTTGIKRLGYDYV